MKRKQGREKREGFRLAFSGGLRGICRAWSLVGPERKHQQTFRRRQNDRFSLNMKGKLRNGDLARQGWIFRLTCSHPELTKNHVLTSAFVEIFRIVTRNAINKSVWRKKDCSWLPLNIHAMNIWLSSLKIRAHLSWRTGNISMFSMCSKLTPRAPIPDTRIPQLMQPWLTDNRI